MARGRTKRAVRALPLERAEKKGGRARFGLACGAIGARLGLQLRVLTQQNLERVPLVGQRVGRRLPRTGNVEVMMRGTGGQTNLGQEPTCVAVLAAVISARSDWA